MHRHPSAHGRLPDFYGLDGTVRLAPRLATREQGRRWVDYNGPVSPQLVDAVVASDADVVAFSPYLYHPTVATIGKVQVPAVFHPAAHDEPALYLPVFRGTFGDADAFCFYTASERTLVERMYQVAEQPQIVLGLGVGDSEGAAAPAASSLGSGTAPTSSASDGSTSTRAPRCSRRTSPPTRSATPDPSPSPSSGRSRWTSRRTPTSW